MKVRYPEIKMKEEVIISLVMTRITIKAQEEEEELVMMTYSQKYISNKVTE